MLTWISSYPKSGNTWIRLLLDAYLNGKCDINNITSCIGDHAEYFYDAVSPIKEMDRTTVNLLRPAALLHMDRCLSQKVKFVKTHNANCEADGITLIPPSLTNKAVYVYRDPRDVVISNANHFGISIDESIDTINDSKRAIGFDDSYVHYLGSWSDHVRSWTQVTDIHVIGVKYENLLSNPERTFKSMLTKLELNPSDEGVRFAVESTNIERLKRQENDNGFREKPSKSSRFFQVGRSHWEDVLTEEQVRKIELAHQNMMRIKGYATVTL